MRGGIYDGRFTDIDKLSELGESESKRIRKYVDRDTQEETMLARERTVGENAEQRRNENIKELADRAVDAKARKALRHELREQGASRREVREILAGIPDE